MTALLTSQGIPTNIKDIFLSLLKKAPNDYRVAFITTAALDKRNDNPSWLEFYREELRNMNITDIEDIDLRHFDKQTLQEKLHDKDIIYVNGGNTYYLMKYVKESGLGDMLPQLLNQHKLYVGVSAGSVIMGPDISLASWIPNDEDVNTGYVTDMKGIGIMPFAVWPHFQQNHQTSIELRIESLSYSVIALTDTQAILWRNNSYEIVGKGEKLIYNPPNTR